MAMSTTKPLKTTGTPQGGHEALIRMLERIYVAIQEIDMDELDEVWSVAHNQKPLHPDEEPPEAFGNRMPKKRIDKLKRFIGFMREEGEEA
jgi:hypothetical protein